VVDTALMGTNAAANAMNINMYTPVFLTGTTLHGVKLCRMWNYDVVRYADGTIAMLGQARADNCTGTPSGSDPDKRAIYGRYDGTKWTVTYLGKMGAKLYASEEDYTGLAALHPNDPTTIYLSSTIDPRDDTTTTTFHEIYQGTTCDNGATFHWIPVTQNSTKDNFRPIIPTWAPGKTALLWFKGTYTSAQSYNAAVVGIIK
jgi:hypothetical protein